MEKMSNKEKVKIINYYLDKLMRIATKGVENEKYELALSALSAYCVIQYRINQVYTDKNAENLVLEISKKLVKVPKDYIGDENTVLFYDRFGLDLRGWAASYVRAIVQNGYKLIYVTNSKSKDSIPHILGEMEGADAKKIFINMETDYTSWVHELNDAFSENRPKFAFLYTTPSDVSAATVFDAYKEGVIRFQIDLTDHAYWIGVNAADYFLECRLPGASNALYERGVREDQIIDIDCCLYINHDKDDTFMPFDIEKERYIFSGGSLYKTLGDKELLFYRVISKVLADNPEVKYLYAGGGDASELEKMQIKYPGRVYHIAERSDFYRLFENCVFMWNTYPMFGGLMMRFSANAGKIPLTLKHGKDHEGLLFNQAELGIEFDTYEEVIEEANKLLEDDHYRQKKEQQLRHAVLTEEAFARNLQMIIEEHTTEFEFGAVPYLDTTEFRKTYIERIDDPRGLVANSIINKLNKPLFPYFTYLIVKEAYNKLFRRSYGK